MDINFGRLAVSLLFAAGFVVFIYFMVKWSIAENKRMKKMHGVYMRQQELNWQLDELRARKAERERLAEEKRRAEHDAMLRELYEHKTGLAPPGGRSKLQPPRR
jgi:gluconate kinase